jgi:hypothetical protein
VVGDQEQASLKTIRRTLDQAIRPVSKTLHIF